MKICSLICLLRFFENMLPSSLLLLLLSLYSVLRVHEKNAPLAQMVEQLTLNQWVPGSSPRWCTREGSLVKRLRLRPLTAASGVRFSHESPNESSSFQKNSKVGANGCEVPPVPIPNTEVKLTHAEDTWLATTRENRTAPTF